jgi:hypothetical protein
VLEGGGRFFAIFPKASDMPRPHGAYMTVSSSQDGSTSIWVVDQIENGVASIEVDGVTMISLPRAVLPKGVREGDVLHVNIAPDHAELVRRLTKSAAQVAKGGSGGKGDIVL